MMNHGRWPSSKKSRPGLRDLTLSRFVRYLSIFNLISICFTDHVYTVEMDAPIELLHYRYE